MVRRICAISLAAVLVIFAVPTYAEESPPQCKSGAVITVSGKMFDDPVYDNDTKVWAFEFRDVTPCPFGDIILSRSKPPAACRSGRQFVARGKLSDGMMGGLAFTATSIECK